VPVELRVLSFNVHGLRDDVDAVAEVVRAADPDVACVQEAPKLLRWRTRCARLARECGLLYVSGGGSTGGTAMLAHLRVRPTEVAVALLARSFGWPSRGIASAVVEKAGARVAVASVHLPLDAPGRLDHAGRVLAHQDMRAEAYTVVAGDLNEPPAGPAWQRLHEAGLRDLGPDSGPTYPATGPYKRIDAILGTAGVEVVDYQVIDSEAARRASDHRPVLATLRVRTDLSG
jgi:endonuclease/exonuclease/phosphatase family metal-dependent hydrolase